MGETLTTGLLCVVLIALTAGVHAALRALLTAILGGLVGRWFGRDTRSLELTAGSIAAALMVMWAVFNA